MMLSEYIDLRHPTAMVRCNAITRDSCARSFWTTRTGCAERHITHRASERAVRDVVDSWLHPWNAQEAGGVRKQPDTGGNEKEHCRVQYQRATSARRRPK